MCVENDLARRGIFDRSATVVVKLHLLTATIVAVQNDGSGSIRF
jgi:hypothetical protein